VQLGGIPPSRLHRCVERAFNRVMGTKTAPNTPASLPGPVVDANSAELEMWLAEGKRLVAEAEARVVSGEFLPALSSLAALPPLHRMLCERLSDIVNATPQGTDESTTFGMYL
jgi:hypothetical protein